MHIIYLDESGTHAEARYFVVAGLAVFERDTYFLAEAFDRLQNQYFPDETVPIPFHISELRAPASRRKPPYNSLPDDQRRALIADVYALIANSRVRPFGIVMEKATITGDPYERGFEEIVNRFDLMLGRLGRDNRDRQRGLIVVAEST